MAVVADHAIDTAKGARRSVGLRAQACIEWLRDYAEKKINSRLIDERRTIPPHIVLDVGNQGLLGMQIPAALGGRLELSMYDTLKVQRQISVRACNRDASRAWLDARIAHIADRAPHAQPPSRALAGEMLADAAVQIGDMQQHAPDEDCSLDRYLCKEFA